MLIIRLQRTGNRNKPSFRIVLAEAYRHASKQAVEVLGHYNPRLKQFGLKDESRVKYWLDQHIKLSPTVHNLFVEKKLITQDKVKAWKPKKKEGGEEAASAAPAAAQPEPTAEAPTAETPTA